MNCAGIAASALNRAGIEPIEYVAAAVDAALRAAGPDAWVCVLPPGTETIPYMTGAAGAPVSSSR